MRIFVATGTQLPFDRLVRTVDEWAGENPAHDVFGQIGPASYRPRHMSHSAFLDPTDFAARSREADVHVTHAGTGSIFAALEMRKILFVLPRRHAFGEHRNDHQLATAEHLSHLPGLNVAGDEVELRRMLDRLDEVAHPPPSFSPVASPQLLDALRGFIEARSASRSAGVATAPTDDTSTR